MHKFYWRNTHGPGARSQTEYHHYNPRLGKSGSADNILSEVTIKFIFISRQIILLQQIQTSLSSIHGCFVLLLCRCPFVESFKLK